MDRLLSRQNCFWDIEPSSPPRIRENQCSCLLIVFEQISAYFSDGSRGRRPKGYKRSADRTHTITQTLRIQKIGNEFQGTMREPSWNGPVESVKNFTGKRMPPMPQTPDPSKVNREKPIKLFNGKDLSGWKLIDEEKVNGFKVANGTLTNDPVQPEDGEHI